MLNKYRLTLGDDRERVSSYAQIRTFESDCDRSQAQIRTAASTWILAGVGGLFVAFSEHRPEELSSELLATGVCFLAILGIAVLWTVDHRVYQKLLHAAFAYGLAVEAQNPDLPQVRTVMNLHSDNIGPALSLYYFGPIVVFVLLSLIFSAIDDTNFAYMLTVFNFEILGGCFAASREWAPLAEVMSSFSGLIQTETERARKVARVREAEPLRKADEGGT